MPLPPLMFTEKLTLYIGRTKKDGDDIKWHSKAQNRCRNQAKRFDLGCKTPRKIDSRVFCMKKYCVCYVHYGKCKEMSFLGLDTSNQSLDIVLVKSC